MLICEKFYKNKGANIEAIYHNEGRIIRNLIGVTPSGKPIYDYRYEYNIKDHLGNTRVCFSDLNDNGIVEVAQNTNYNELLQQNHYYPFGLNMTENILMDNGQWTIFKNYPLSIVH